MPLSQGAHRAGVEVRLPSGIFLFIVSRHIWRIVLGPPQSLLLQIARSYLPCSWGHLPPPIWTFCISWLMTNLLDIVFWLSLSFFSLLSLWTAAVISTNSTILSSTQSPMESIQGSLHAEFSRPVIAGIPSRPSWNFKLPVYNTHFSCVGSVFPLQFFSLCLSSFPPSCLPFFLPSFNSWPDSPNIPDMPVVQGFACVSS